MSLEQVIGLIKQITVDLRPNCDNIIQTIDDLSNYHNENEQSESVNLQELFYENVEQQCKKVCQETKKEIQSKQNEFNVKLQSNQCSIEKLEQTERELLNEIREKEQKILKIKQEIDKNNAKIDAYQPLQNAVKVYKLLTGTVFCGNENEVIGYMATKNNFLTFNYRTNIDQMAIEEKLWESLNELSDGNPSKIAEEILAIKD